MWHVWSEAVLCLHKTHRFPWVGMVTRCVTAVWSVRAEEEADSGVSQVNLRVICWTWCQLAAAFRASVPPARFPSGRRTVWVNTKKLQCSLTLMQHLPLQAKQEARTKAATWSEAAHQQASEAVLSLCRSICLFVVASFKGKTTHDVYWFNEVHH